MTRHVAPTAAALCLFLAACSSSQTTDASFEGVDDPTTAEGLAAGQVAGPTASSAGTEPAGSARVLPTGIDEMALAEIGPDGVVSTSTTVAVKPVTTIRGGGGDSTSMYRGVLGSLGPDEVVVAPIVEPPAGAEGVMPLTGEFGVVPSRSAAVVKIDNSPAARPQTGLNVADIVVEEEVEGGLTRLAAIFHSRTTTVGPVRSGRTTDIGVLASLGTPLLIYSGANRVTDTLLRRQSAVQNRSFETSSGYWRGRGKAPSNLFTDLGDHWASATGGPPPPLFAYRDRSDPVLGSPVSELSITFPANRVRWSWDEGASSWLRYQGSSAHTVFAGEQVTAANVVVVEAREVATGMVDGAGSSVPEFVFVGTGPVSVFTAGNRIDGVWTRPTLSSVATLTTPEGQIIELTTGRTWIELIRDDRDMLSSLAAAR
ncbi:MAG: DUF3048 domain-containing protein [Actinomycetia bacterium]|nr:DUF3048 domain-containing protein [Actinomycetes bacterium]